ncbi:MAG: hypothetical protein QW814_01580 [Methanothrix sp.]
METTNKPIKRSEKKVFEPALGLYLRSDESNYSNPEITRKGKSDPETDITYGTSCSNEDEHPVSDGLC